MRKETLLAGHHQPLLDALMQVVVANNGAFQAQVLWHAWASTFVELMRVGVWWCGGSSLKNSSHCVLTSTAPCLSLWCSSRHCFRPPLLNAG